MQIILNESPDGDSVIDYGFDVGDVVCHQAETDAHGIVTELDSDHDLGGVTTCRVAWGANTWEEAMAVPREDQDIQWTNKLYRVDTV